MRFLKKILFVVMVGTLGIFQVNAAFQMKRQLELPDNLNYSNEDPAFYDIEIDSENKIFIRFPEDGKQPTSNNAAKYSCASIKNDKVTAWYIWAFGGKSALDAVYGKNPPIEVLHSFSLFGFFSVSKPVEKIVAQGYRSAIIFLRPGSDEKRFWGTLKKIAETPIGRVLLYRLLIEINRVIIKPKGTPQDDYVENHSGVPETSVPKRRLKDINERNNCRSLDVKLDSKTSESGFFYEERKILLGTGPVTLTVLVKKYDHIVPTITTQLEPAPLDIVLFHEMLHWFHFLRNPVLYKEKGPINFSNYTVLSYYGDLSELFVWGVNSSFDAEEIKTILGTPDWKDDMINELICYNAIRHKNKKYLEGDDLSENAYRISRDIETPDNYKIRFGHTDMQIPEFYLYFSNQSFPMNRFSLAYMCAMLAAKRASCLAE